MEAASKSKGEEKKKKTKLKFLMFAHIELPKWIK